MLSCIWVLESNKNYHTHACMYAFQTVEILQIKGDHLESLPKYCLPRCHQNATAKPFADLDY